MLLHALRQIFIKKKTQNKLLENGEFSEVQFNGTFPSILILVGEDENENIKDVLASELDIPIRNIELLKFCKTIKKEEILEGQFSPNTFGWFGKIKSEVIEELVRTEYDVLLNYTISNLYIDYITSISNAKLKVGYSNREIRLYDLMIDVKEPSTTIFNSELKKYLKVLNK